MVASLDSISEEWKDGLKAFSENNSLWECSSVYLFVAVILFRWLGNKSYSIIDTSYPDDKVNNLIVDDM